MATYTTWLAPGGTRKKTGQKFFLYNTIDFAHQTLDAGNGDVAQVMHIRKGTYVFNVWLNVLHVAPANSTVDLGYGGDVDYWGAALRLDTAGVLSQKYIIKETASAQVIGNRALFAGVPVYFADSDTIDIVATVDVADVNISSGKIEIIAECWRKDIK